MKSEPKGGESLTHFKQSPFLGRGIKAKGLNQTIIREIFILIFTQSLSFAERDEVSVVR
jgi:hypothetical protein